MGLVPGDTEVGMARRVSTRSTGSRGKKRKQVLTTPHTEVPDRGKPRGRGQVVSEESYFLPRKWHWS